MRTRHVELHLRNGVTRHIDVDEGWEFKDTERVVLILDADRRVLHAVNLGDFVDMAVTTVQDGDAG